MPEDQSAAELATQYATYANLIVGFTVAQAIAYAYKLADGQFRIDVAGFRPLYWWIAIPSFVYLLLVVLCGVGERNLRDESGQRGTVLTCTTWAIVGRAAIVALVSGFVLGATYYAIPH